MQFPCRLVDLSYDRTEVHIMKANPLVLNYEQDFIFHTNSILFLSGWYSAMEAMASPIAAFKLHCAGQLASAATEALYSCLLSHVKLFAKL